MRADAMRHEQEKSYIVLWRFSGIPKWFITSIVFLVRVYVFLRFQQMDRRFTSEIIFIRNITVLYWLDRYEVEKLAGLDDCIAVGTLPKVRSECKSERVIEKDHREIDNPFWLGSVGIWQNILLQKAFCWWVLKLFAVYSMNSTASCDQC